MKLATIKSEKGMKETISSQFSMKNEEIGDKN